MTFSHKTGRNAQYRSMREGWLAEAEEGAGSLRSGRRRSASPLRGEEVAPTTCLEDDWNLSSGYETTSSEVDLTSDPLTILESDPPEEQEAIQAANDAYQKTRHSPKHLQEEATCEVFLARLRADPALCQQVLDEQEYVTDGWCKLSTKNGNVSFLPCNIFQTDKTC
jgi:hypothetical protein